MKYQLVDLERVCRELIERYPAYRVWCFTGEMGTGKTTMIKQLCRVLGVVHEMTSPTFSILNEYRTRDGKIVYHFDCYRLENEAEAIDIGVEEFFESGSYCFVEWSQRIAGLLPSKYLEINSIFVKENERELLVTTHG